MIKDEDWKQIDDAVPTDGTPIHVLTINTFRFEPYRNPEQGTFRHAEEINGVKGRWQYFDERGNWTNCARPAGKWQK